MSKRKQGRCQITAAAQAGISERSGRRIEKAEHQPKVNTPRTYRTRVDPLEGVWDSDLKVKLEHNPQLKPKTLYLHLKKAYPGQYPSTILRTLQRRVREWKFLHGPEREVMFLQEHPMGQQGISDFTHFKQATITINGQPLPHLIYHYRLSYSGWCYAKVVIGGESFAALSEGLQNALFQCGGVPKEHRTDSLTAAFKNLTRDDQRDLTQNYEALCRHYHLEATRNNRGKGHENGSIESPHGHLKNRLHQQLLLRQSVDFPSIEAYQDLIDEVVASFNEERKEQFELERKTLQALPRYRFQAFHHVVAQVTTQSTINVRCVLYSVPSRLIGATLNLHLYDARIEGYLGYQKTLELDRVYAPSGAIRRTHCIDYRHIIDALHKKPGAFKNCRYREEILPNEHYRGLFKQMQAQVGMTQACKLMVCGLYLAARYDKETAVARYLTRQLNQNAPPTLAQLQAVFTPFQHDEICQTVVPVSSAHYDSLLTRRSPQGGSHAN